VFLERKIHTKFKDHVDGLSAVRWDNIKEIFDLDSNIYTSFLKFVKQILKGAFDMEYSTETRGTRVVKKTLSMIHSRQLPYDIECMRYFWVL
jgi:hypothetical protein